MKRRNWVLSAVAAAVFLAGPAYALEGFYVGAGAVNWTYNEPATTPEDLSGTMKIRKPSGPLRWLWLRPLSRYLF